MIVATAGHVDHGKTSLVRNLTGVETDRLEEEQRRGLSINLGYAYAQLDNGSSLGFIDVPGHRRFINTMISGVSGIDLGMLIVAADDGPMPQTREHLQVMSLLGVDNFIAVITKCDRVDAGRIEQVCTATAELLSAQSSIADSRIYKVSNTDGTGIDELRAELERRARLCKARAIAGNFRMSVDRTFNLQGLGLVLTGTIASGTVATGESIVLQPQDKTLRVRGIHVQDTPSPQGSAGERCALNVSGSAHKDDIQRGDWVVSESCIDPSSRFDARIHLLPDAAFALKHLSEVKLHIGAKHLKARLILLKREDASPSRIHPGESALAQLVTERPVLCCHGDRFLLRDYGETATLGGGVVLDPRGLKYRKSSTARLDFLDAMAHEDIEDAIQAALALAPNDTGEHALNYTALMQARNIDPRETPGADIPDIARIQTPNAEFWLPQSHWSGLKKKILEAILKLHRKDSSEPGFRPSQISRTALSTREQHFFQPAIVELVRSKDISIKDGLLSASGHEASISAEQHDWLAIAACLQKHGNQIPVVTQLEKECGIEQRSLMYSIGRAQRDGKIIKVSEKRYALVSILNAFAQAALDLTTDGSELTVVGYRDHMGCGRNAAVDVLEYFDGIRFTRREGEGRIILNRKLPDRLFDA